MTKEELIEFIKIILNLDTTPSYIYLDVSNSLDNIKDYEMFIKEFKSLYSTLKLQLEYKTAYQKFLMIMEVINNQRFALLDKEVIQIEDFKTKLYNKLTDICEYLREDKIPTVEYIKNIDFNNIKNADKTMYFEPKEIKVNLILGDSLELYRLSTQNKTLLQERIKEIIIDLVKQNKTNKVAIDYKNNPVAKLMNKGK